MAVPDLLTVAQARRVALAAQGFTDPAPGSVPDLRHLRRVLRRVQLLQMDSVKFTQSTSTRSSRCCNSVVI